MNAITGLIRCARNQSFRRFVCGGQTLSARLRESGATLATDAIRWRFLGLAALMLWALSWGVQFTARASPGSIRPGLQITSPLSAFDGDPPISQSSDWLERRVPLLQRAFVTRVYGVVPQAAPRDVQRRTIDSAALGGTARLELLTVSLGQTMTDTPLDVALLAPAGEGPFPLIIMSDFCGLDSDIDPRLPAPIWRPERCRTQLGRALTRLSHGDAILRPPLRAMIERGYAVAVFYAGDVAPDDPVLFREAQINRGAGSAKSGAIADWASLYLSAFDALRIDPRISPAHIAFWGHSRYGKAALLAAALDNRVGAVIANQSGTFGATLSSATRGETTAQIVRRFPHWFPDSLASSVTQRSMDGLDQHMLLALLAPRPVLLGNAGLDRWSDPAASFAAARAASEVYGLFGSAGLVQPSMRQPDLSADIAFYVRPGGHGVRSSDWSTALDFLDQHFEERPGA